MSTVNRKTLAATVARMSKVVQEADVQRRVPVRGSNGSIGTRVVRKPDDAVNSFEVRKAASTLSEADARLLYSAHRGALSSDGRSDTASVKSIEKNLKGAMTTLLAADRDGDGVVQWDEVFTRSGNPRAGIGKVAARLFVATQED